MSKRSPDYLTAVGIGVSDLAKSADFYSRVLGMKQTATFKIDTMDEIVLAHEGRNAVVLMHYTDGSARNYKDNPIKLVFQVEDAARLIEEGVAAWSGGDDMERSLIVRGRANLSLRVGPTLVQIGQCRPWVTGSLGGGADRKGNCDT